MKKTLLSLSVILSFLIKANAGQQINFTGALFYNSTNSTITVQLMITNTSTNGTSGCGNQNLDLAVIRHGLQWNRNVLTLVSWNFVPAGTGLDASEYFIGNPGNPNDDIPDALTKGIRTIGAKVDSTYDFTRSTNLCDNTINLLCDETAVLFEAVFYIDPTLAASGYYDFTHPNDNTNYPNYIAEFNDGTSAPSNTYKEILFISNRPYDTPGNSCPPGSTVGNNVSNVPDDSKADVFVNTQGPLAVHVLNFEAFKQTGKTVLYWQTSSEINNRGFEIQRKLKGGFQSIGFIPSAAVYGNSESNLSYSFTDAASFTNETVYYRLKQISFSATVGYSEIRAIRNSRSLEVLVYPNPSNGKLNIVVPGGEGTTDINMVDFSGKLIRSWVSFKLSNIQLTGLQKGVYTLLISNRESGERVVQKIIVR